MSQITIQVLADKYKGFGGEGIIVSMLSRRSSLTPISFVGCTQKLPFREFGTPKTRRANLQ
jgi:hypothetical protein